MYGTIVWYTVILTFLPSSAPLSQTESNRSTWTAIFIHPIHDTCFPDNSQITMALSLPTNFFLEESHQNSRFKLFLNNVLAGEGALHGDDMAEDGFNLMISVPHIDDGNYSAYLEVLNADFALHGVPKNRVLATGATRFSVDSAQSCESQEMFAEEKFGDPDDSRSVEMNIVNLARGCFARMSTMVW